MDESHRDAIATAERMAENRFGDGEYTLASWFWCDGDYRIEARSSIGNTDAGNSVRNVIVITPDKTTIQIVETTQREEMNIIAEQDAVENPNE